MWKSYIVHTVKIFLTQDIFGPRYFRPKIFLAQDIFGPRYFWPKIFLAQDILGQDILGKRYFRSKIFWVNGISQDILGQDILGQDIFSRHQKNWPRGKWVEISVLTFHFHFSSRKENVSFSSFQCRKFVICTKQVPK